MALLDLTTKKCVPCDTKDLRPMAKESARHLMPKVLFHFFFCLQNYANLFLIAIKHCLGRRVGFGE